MAVGTIFTLFVIPSIYMLVARDHSQDRVREAVMATIPDPSGGPAAKPQSIT
jgi:multidrug efflux pump